MADQQKALDTTSHGAVAEGGDFAALLNKEFKPQTDRARTEVEVAVKTLAEQALAGANLTSSDAVTTIKAIIAELDKKLTDQVDQIIHHQDFQELEGAWRGLHYLVNNSETDQTLKIRVMNVSKKDLGKTLARFKGAAWDQSPIFKKVYEQEFGQLGGEPFGCLVGDYYFDHSPPDVELLGEMAQISAASHAPFMAAAAPSLFQMESWQELSNPRDLTKIFSTPEYASWRSLRDSDDSRYVGLAMPRFLARNAIRREVRPGRRVRFRRGHARRRQKKFTWANSAYAMAVNINRSFKLYGWCSRIRGIESGGAVAGLPTHTFPTDDGGVDMTCPTEIAISDRREAELAKSGFMPLIHKQELRLRRLHRRAVAPEAGRPTTTPTRRPTPNLAARLPYLFATCRFAHYLKCIVRDKIGSFKERDDMQHWLHDWIMQYVDGDPAHSSEETKARKPLADAEVVVEEVEGEPGYYNSKFFLRPHYQLEGLTVSLRLVSKLPSVKGGA